MNLCVEHGGKSSCFGLETWSKLVETQLLGWGGGGEMGFLLNVVKKRTLMNFLMIPHFIDMVILETEEFHSMVCMMLFYI